MANDLLTPPNGTAKPARPAAAAPVLTPRVDILETENEFLVHADVPGVAPDGVDVRFEDGELTVHARRQSAAAGAARAAGSGGYFRSFRLTEHVAADKIEADLKHGVLTLRLPKVEAVKPRRITVRG